MPNESLLDVDYELLEDFLADSFEILNNLSPLIEELDLSSANKHFEIFGQQIDRMMGAAYTLSLTLVGDLCRCGKEIGYKGSQIEEASKLMVVQSLLGQLERALRTILNGLKKRQAPDPHRFKMLLVRLNKANKDLGDLRSTVQVSDG